MSERHHLSTHNPLDVFYERGHVVRPLGPFANVPARARALAMAAQINRKRPEPIPGHRLRESLIPARMVSKAMYDGKRQLSVGFRPRAVRQFGSVGGHDCPLAGEGTLSQQGGQNLSGS